MNNEEWIELEAGTVAPPPTPVAHTSDLPLNLRACVFSHDVDLKNFQPEYVVNVLTAQQEPSENGVYVSMQKTHCSRLCMLPFVFDFGATCAVGIRSVSREEALHMLHPRDALRVNELLSALRNLAVTMQRHDPNDLHSLCRTLALAVLKLAVNEWALPRKRAARLCENAVAHYFGSGAWDMYGCEYVCAGFRPKRKCWQLWK